MNAYIILNIIKQGSEFTLDDISNILLVSGSKRLSNLLSIKMRKLADEKYGLYERILYGKDYVTDTLYTYNCQLCEITRKTYLDPENFFKHCDECKNIHKCLNCEYWFKRNENEYIGFCNDCNTFDICRKCYQPYDTSYKQSVKCDCK